MGKKISSRKITRRQFLKTTAIGAGGLTLSSLGFPTILRAAKEPIIIGLTSDSTGFLASYGRDFEKAAKGAVDYANTLGGIGGRPVKLVIEDTASDPATGIRKFRRLVELERCDFVLGSVHSGVCIGIAPVAKELKTPYFPSGMATEITAEKGNRYIFRIITHVRQQVQAAHKFAMDNISKEWFICNTDYAWGWSHRDWFKKLVEEAGGKVTGIQNIPVGTKDFMPYLAKIPGDTKAVYFATLGADTLGFIRQIQEIGYKGKKFSVVCNYDGVDIGKLGAAVEGDWTLEYLPRTLADFDTPHHRMLRRYAHIDDYGFEIGGTAVCTGSHYWAKWEEVFLIKAGVEKSGWKNKKDTPKFIEALEGLSLKEGHWFPQGDKVIRAEDHQAFPQMWLSRIEGGKLRTKFKIPPERSTYPPPVDYRKESL
jgi:branched-chain amino acid transport system substrate-binding protein